MAPGLMLTRLATTLGQQTVRQHTGDILLALAGLLIAILLIAAIGFAVRKRLTAPPESVDETLSLSDLRRLHREGHISDEEFEKTRALIVARTQAALERDEQRREQERRERERRTRRLPPADRHDDARGADPDSDEASDNPSESE